MINTIERISMIAENLKKQGIVIPELVMPVANYVPYITRGNTVYISGQLPLKNGVLVSEGIINDENIDQGVEAAETCALNILAAVRSACDGDIERVVQCIKLGGFVQSNPGFKNHPKVINGASDFMVKALGDQGKHARFAVGASSLPLNASVEIDAVFEIK